MKNTSFKTKLIALCSFMALVSVVISYVGYKGLKDVSRDFHDVSQDSLPNIANLNNMYLAFREVRVNVRSLGLNGITKEQGEVFVKGTKAAIEEYERVEKDYLSVDFKPGEEALYNDLKASWVSFKGVGAKALELYEIGTPDAMKKLTTVFLEDCPKNAEHLNAAMGKLKKFHLDRAAANVRTADTTVLHTSRMMIVVSVIGIIIGLIGGLLFAQSMSNSINQVISGLLSNSDQVAVAAQQISSSSQNLSQAVTEQASSLEETAASLEEISSMIGKSSDNAALASASSSESLARAQDGKAAVDKMLGSMDEISQSNDSILSQINDSNRQMAEIVKVIQEIGNKTKVINEIVFQTKLLSFNASVEAARAGEHGKGFAVVAEEVGNLAQMSGNAAKEITDMLDASVSKVENIASDTKQKVETLLQNGKEKVDSGVSTAQRCADVLNEILQNVAKVSSLAQEISEASKEQSQGVGEINKAIAQLDAVTQQNSSTSEEAAGSAEQLSIQAIQMKNAVQGLASLMNGSSRRVGEHSVPAVSPVASQGKKSKKFDNVIHANFGSKNETQPASPKKAVGSDTSPDHSAFGDF